MAAPATVAAISSKLHLRSSSPSLRSSGRQATPSFRCSAGSDDGKATPLLLKLAVGGVTALLSFLSPKKSRGDSKGEAVTLACSADDVVRILRSDYDRAYFLTGFYSVDVAPLSRKRKLSPLSLQEHHCHRSYTITKPYRRGSKIRSVKDFPRVLDGALSSPSFAMTDPGKDKYSQNLELLIPFFDGPSLKLEKIEKGYNNEMNFVVAAWELSTYLKLPWRPFISIRGSTIYDLDKEFKIVRHSESWNISALDAVGQIFTFGSREGDE